MLVQKKASSSVLEMKVDALKFGFHHSEDTEVAREDESGLRATSVSSAVSVMNRQLHPT
jgi:hypothetical protein